MREILLTIEFLVGACALLLLIALLVTLVRRRHIAQGQALIVCAVRLPGVQRWRYGLMRYTSSGLDWFTLFGVSLRPRFHWDRSRLDFGPPSPIPVGSVADTLIPGAVLVPCSVAQETFDLALSRAPYTALRSWLEAQPPGQHLDVA